MTGEPTDRLCAQVFGGPDTATISGVIDEMAVETSVDRTDTCMIHDWDELLGELLPPARGSDDDEASTSPTSTEHRRMTAHGMDSAPQVTNHQASAPPAAT